MLPFSATVSSQIRYLLQSLNESNSDCVFQELRQYIGYGIEGRILMLKACFDHLNIYKNDLKNIRLDPGFVCLFKCMLNKHNFSTVLCESLRSTSVSEVFLDNLSSAFGLSVTEKIGIGLALSDSENIDVKMCGKNFCMAQIGELGADNVYIGSTENIQNILIFLNRSECLSKHVDSFMQMLSLVQLKGGDEFILSPLVSDEMREANLFRVMDLLNDGVEDDFDTVLAEMEEEMSMADIMRELGYGCTVNVSQCKEMLSLFLPLTEVTVARILDIVARTHTGLGDNQNAFLTYQSALGISNISDIPLLSSWNIDVLVDSVKQLAPGINWVNVVENLDYEGFYVPNEAAFSFLISVYRHACQDPFPLHAVCSSVWKNAEGQLSFLKYAVAVPPEVFSFSHSAKQLASIDAVNGHKFQLVHANHAWQCLDLLEVLCQLAESGHAGSVRLMLEYPVKYCPEVLLLGMAHINTTYNLLQYEVSSTVLPLILKDTLGNDVLLHLWHVNPNILLRGFLDIVDTDPDNTSRVLDICQELKILSQVLEMVPYSFGIRLAALASVKELIDLEKWLNTYLSTYKDVFFEECVKFSREVQFALQDVSSNNFHHSGALWDLYSGTSSTFLKVLQSHAGSISSSQLTEEMEKLHMTLLHASSRLKNGVATDSPNSDGHVDDIEAEANSYFHQMFSGQLSIDAMIQLLSRFKESMEQRGKSLFECMIANLFEEYKFFSKYPERQLKIAAVLFGSTIKHQLVTHITLGIALRAVLDALRKPPDSKMFLFGVKALEQFMDRLIEWPQYCNHILQISHMRGSHSELVLYIDRVLAKISSGHVELDVGHTAADQHPTSIQATATSLEVLGSSFPSIGGGGLLQVSSPIQLQHRQQGSLAERHKASITNFTKSAAEQPSVIPSSDSLGSQKSLGTVTASATLASSHGFVSSSRAITSTRFGSALNIETLVAAAERKGTLVEEPALEVQDKISFVINNLSVANIEAKAKEFTEILKEQYYPWFAQYMVMKRASIEQNFHDLYLKFLDKVNSKSLYKEVVQATYENCKVLLGSELIKSSSEERSLLKNLGSWLGKITIGRNQVLRAREIDPKSLIIEAYEKGLMIAVIPFTSKVLDSCHSSLAYQPPNPWTMGVLGLLTEIYAMQNLKMNLKFEIEVLFKNLYVDMKDVAPTSLLKDKVREVDGNPDFSNKDVGSSQPQMSGEVIIMPQIELPLDVASPSHPGGRSRILPQYAASVHLSPGALVEDEKLAAFGLSDQLPSAQGLPQVQSPFSVSQFPAQSSNLEQQVIVNHKLHALGLHLHFQSVLPIAMERAIKEIVSSIVQRSVSIATQTTKELVLKDYAMESDENRIRNAAHLMVASLSGSLAHVTCKEPLRGSISSQLRNSFQGLNIASELLEQAVQLVTNDNLDLGCALIEQAATEKAIQTIDGEIAQQLSMRRKHREGVGLTFFDPSVYTQGHMMGILPEALRPKLGRLSHTQQRVYEDFVRLPWQNQSNQSPNAVPISSSVSSGNGGLSRTYGSASGLLDSGIYSSGLRNAGIGNVAQPLDLISEKIETNASHVHSVSSTNIVVSDAVGSLNFESGAAVVSFPLASATELHTVEPSNADLGTSSQPLSATPASEQIGSNISEPLLTTGDALDNYQMISEKLEMLVASNAKQEEIQVIISDVPGIILRCTSRDEAALAVAQKVFQGLYENASNPVHVSAHLAILVAIRDVSKRVFKELTSWVIYSDEDRKFNKDVTVGLICSELLNLAEYNVHMAKLVDAGRNKAATEFAISLVQTLVVSDSSVISELHNLIDALAKLASRPGSLESLQQLIEIAKNPSANATALSGVTIGKEDTNRQSRDKKAVGHPMASMEDSSVSESVEPDTTGFREQVSMLFAEWYRICELPGSNDAACAHFVVQLQQNGLLKGDDVSDCFFRHLMELSVSHCLSSEVTSPGAQQLHQHLQPLSFLAIDIYSKLVFSILKFCHVDHGSNKLAILPKVLAVTVKFIQKDVEERNSSFNPRPYFRLFINWLLDLSSLDAVFDSATFQVLAALANAFHALQPLKVPGFSFAWLELVSHRSFMPKLLTGNHQKGWPYFQRLLVDLLQFMEPFLRNAELREPVHFLYKGTLRVLLVLLHDFPEFLCDYNFSFCDVIPPSCIQMRNIVLSAFPRNMRLPDPSTPNLKIDLLAEISQSPRILSEVDAALKAKQIKNDVDEYSKTRQQGSFLSELKQKLLLSPSDATRVGTRYNVPLINSLVLYVGMQAIQQLQTRTPTHAAQAPHVFLVGAALDIFQTLIVDLDTEGRYLFLNAVANQLRYPNNHTHYFSFVLLYLFSESNQEVIQEQITRVLLERLIVNRPHPWGLLITFIELIKNDRYNFWSRSFTRCAPEIEKLFESVSRSCGGPKPVDERVSGSLSDNIH